MKHLLIFIESIGIHNETLKQAIKYLFVGGFCTLIDFSLLFVLAQLCGINYLISSVISFMGGSILNYFACTYWIFRIRIVKKRQYEFMLYILISAVGLIINTFCIWLLTAYASLYFMISKLLSTIVTYFWNFFARKFILHYKQHDNI